MQVLLLPSPPQPPSTQSPLLSSAGYHSWQLTILVVVVEVMRSIKFLNLKKNLTPHQNAAHDRHHDAWSPVCCHWSNNQPDLCPCHTPHTALLVGLLICSAMYYILHCLVTLGTLQCAVWKCLSALHSMSSHTHLTEVCSALCSACLVVSFFFQRCIMIYRMPSSPISFN